MSNILLVLLPIFTQNLMLICFSRFLSFIFCQQHSMNIYNFLYWLSMAHLVCILRKLKSTHVWICTGTNVCLINYWYTVVISEIVITCVRENICVCVCWIDLNFKIFFLVKMYSLSIKSEISIIFVIKSGNCCIISPCIVLFPIQTEKRKFFWDSVLLYVRNLGFVLCLRNEEFENFSSDILFVLLTKIVAYFKTTQLFTSVM